MIAPVARLKKSDIVWLHTHRCRHRHNFLEHYQCYLDEVKQGERVGYFDIETSNLKANFGICYCYCIKPAGEKEPIVERVITKSEIRNCLDKEVVEQFIEDIKQFDRLVGYYSSRFDMPFMRTRALYHGIDFPGYGERFHRDLYFVAKRNLATHSRRLEVVAETLLGHSRKTKIDPRHWITAMSGDDEALQYIVEHCRYDVLDLEAVHRKLEPFYIELDTSI